MGQILILFEFIIFYWESLWVGAGVAVFQANGKQNCIRACAAHQLKNSQVSRRLESGVQVYGLLNKVPPAVLHCFFPLFPLPLGRETMFPPGQRIAKHKQSNHCPKAYKTSKPNRTDTEPGKPNITLDQA